MQSSPDTIEFPEFREVAEVLAAAAAPASPAELAGEAAALVAFRTAWSEPPAAAGSSWTRSRWGFGRKAALAAIGVIGLVSVGGVAAATGSLPDVAQDAARGALTKVGVDVPRGKATAPGQLKKADDAKPKQDEPGKQEKPTDPASVPGVPKENSGQGATISSIAHDPALTGAEKGAAVSDAASDGKSRAGEKHGPPSSTPAGPPTSSPSDTAPGKATASTAGPKGDPAVKPGKGGRP